MAAIALLAGPLAARGARADRVLGVRARQRLRVRASACPARSLGRRRRARSPSPSAATARRSGNAHSAIVALAGGPGQAAIPFAEEFDELLGPIAATRDLIVFDQRGTGLSHPLSCHAFERTCSPSRSRERSPRCAAQLGSTRAFYTTADSVADIEAIRQAGGYEKLVLYGTSYGTKVAEEYAAGPSRPRRSAGARLGRHRPPAPTRSNRPTFTGAATVLRAVCRQGACRGVTRDPARRPRAGCCAGFTPAAECRGARDRSGTGTRSDHTA